MNALRGPAYNRLDADMIRDFHIFHSVLNIHGGLENATWPYNRLVVQAGFLSKPDPLQVTLTHLYPAQSVASQSSS
jgi:hypothetical protein